MQDSKTVNSAAYIMCNPRTIIKVYSRVRAQADSIKGEQSIIKTCEGQNQETHSCRELEIPCLNTILQSETGKIGHK